MKRMAMILAALALLSSCTTVDHRLNFKPVRSDSPVSLSGYFFGPGGKVVDPSGYTVLRHFSFEKEIVAAIKPTAAKEIDIDLSKEFNDLLAESGGDAVVNVTIVPRGIDVDDESWVAVDRIFGGMSLGFGGMFLIMGLTMPDYETGDPDPTLMSMGLVFSGIGGAFTIASMVQENNGVRTWHFTVEGDVVRRR